MPNGSGAESRVLRRDGPELIAVQTVGAMTWLAWASIFWLVQPAWAYTRISLLAGAVVPLGIAILLWIGLAYLHPGNTQTRALAVVYGVLASVMWMPALWIAAALIPFAIISLVFFALPLAMIPVVLWGAFCGSWALNKHALRTLGA